MVYNGPSKGCRLCRKRRVKCDQAKPACNNCTKRRVECPGYDSTFDYRHRNETSSTILRAQQKDKTDGSRRRSSATVPSLEDTLSTSHKRTHTSTSELVMTLSRATSPNITALDKSSIMDILDPDPEAVVLNWYFTNYPMRCIDPEASSGFVMLLKPLYASSSPDSPLRPAVAAVASNLLMLFCHQGSDSDLARKFYAQAITRMKSMVADPVRNRQDDLMLTTLALNFYDTINLRWHPEASNYHNHRDGALALFRHRGAFNTENESSRHITTCVRTALCHWALESGMDIPVDVLEWLTPSSLPTNKSTALDVISLDLIRFQSLVNELYQNHHNDKSTLDQTRLQSLVDEGLRIDDMFVEWKDTCLSHWHPVYLSTDELLPSIRAAGAYGSRCAVYWDLPICDSWNTYRARRLILLRLVRQLCLDNGTQQRLAIEAANSIETTMKPLIDAQCEVLPFMIGDVIDPIRHHDLYTIKYPSAMKGLSTYPNPDFDHPRAAVSSGGWLASYNIVSVVKLAMADGYLDPFPIPKSQFDWVFGQLNRLHRVFLLSQPTIKSRFLNFQRHG